MKVLVTGANGFIGKRIIPSLLKQGHDLCLFLRIGEVDIPPLYKSKVQFVHGDLLDPSSIHFPEDIDAAFYLVHSMTEKNKDFYELEEKTALNFLDALKRTKAKQIIYLSGLITDKELSKHLSSRLNVENILKNSSFHFTGFRAGIIIGAGSASFEMIRDLVEKLPFMIAPRWVLNKVQPIASTDVVYYMTHALGLESTYGKTFDIGSEDILTFKEMLETYAKVRHLKRKIFVIPFFYPHLSVWWLNLVTSVNYHLAKALVQSLKNNAICSENSIKSIIERNCLSYEKSLNRAFNKIEENDVVSTWSDAWDPSNSQGDLEDFMQVPTFGTYCWLETKSFHQDPSIVMDRIFSIGGQKGWYFMTWIWKLRGFLDKLFGGVGSGRGRRNEKKVLSGDALDFWRVLIADRQKMRLLLYAEMKLPGEGWLEFRIEKQKTGWVLYQKATFRPHGIWGRIYWLSMFPFHCVLFKGMIKKLTEGEKS
jgi:uncharacterized protein YbjT (DUF2867 family)